MTFINSQLYLAILVLTIASSTISCSNSNVISFKSGEMTHKFAINPEYVKKNMPFPIYPNSNITGFVENKDQETASYFMSESNQSVEKVKQFYLDFLKANGYNYKIGDLGDNVVNISCDKSNIEANIMISSYKLNTNININYTLKSAINDTNKSKLKNIDNPLDSTD